MSDKATLLIEVGCEEIPARMIPAAAQDLAKIVTEILERGGLGRGPETALWTPRRLAVVVQDVEIETRAGRVTVTGPPESAAWDADGKPTRAAEGFARRHGVEANALQRAETDKGRYAAVVVEQPARGVGELLADSFESAVARMTFPKTMRWGDGSHTFVRPVHWLVALAGARVLPLTLFGVESGRASRGHRLIAPGPVEIASADEYAESLERAGVVVDPLARRAALAEALAACAAAEGGRLVDDDALLTETSDMVEFPGAIAGRFDERFVRGIPVEVLKTCLRHHQRAFMLQRDDSPLPAFAVAVNASGDPEGHIRRGNEWVVSGRLEDAAFFWEEDRRRPLADRQDALTGVTFQRELGSFADKAARVVALAGRLAEELGVEPETVGALERSARLARCDLVTGLVGEFPELQGVAGGLLARADGEPHEVADAIYHLYRPASATDDLPPTRSGRLLGLADRMDTLAGTFAIGLAPTGSRDPFALRRQATASVRLASALGSIDLAASARLALETYRRAGVKIPAAGAGGDDEVVATLSGFLFERFSTLAADAGARYDEIGALRPLARTRLDPADLGNRLRALREFRGSADFLSLAASAKRVRNILAQARERGDPVDDERAPERLELAAERQLDDEIQQAVRRADPAVRALKYAEALAAVAALRPAIDNFFDEVLVMDQDERRRHARLALLGRFDRLAHSVVDLSELVVEGDAGDGDNE